jgi:hypothetical protein
VSTQVHVVSGEDDLAGTEATGVGRRGRDKKNSRKRTITPPQVRFSVCVCLCVCVNHAYVPIKTTNSMKQIPSACRV